MTKEWLCTLSFVRISLVTDELLPFDFLNVNELFRPQPWMDFHEPKT